MPISSNQKPIRSEIAAKTAASVIAGDMDLTGKTAVITGGYSGIGLETVRVFAAAGAKVFVPVRNPEKAAETLASMGGDISSVPMDLGDLPSVERFASVFLEHNQSLDFLINNAGVMACPEARIGNGWESQFAINHLGHFLLTDKLLGALAHADGARVVQLSSTAHRRSGIRFEDLHFNKDPYEKWEAYGQAKSANSLFAVELDRRMKDKNIRAFAVHPGGINTPLQRHLTQKEMIAFGWLDESGELTEFAAKLFKTPQEGASTTVWCALSPQLNNIGGVYCEDCDVAQLGDDSSPMFFHVQPHAVDIDVARRLWDVTERMLSEA